MKVSKVVLIVVALHVLVIGGIFIFEGCSRAKAPADMTASIPADEAAAATAAGAPVDAAAATAQNLASTGMQPGSLAPMPVVPPVTPVATAPVTKSYVVKKGDSLSKIAKTQGTTQVELAKANQLTKTSILKIGQKLTIPTKVEAAVAMSAPAPMGVAPVDAMAPAPAVGGASYAVKSGDSLWKIAKAHNISVASLKSANNLSSDSLKINQKLTIPVGQTAATSPAGVAPTAYSEWQPGAHTENGQMTHTVDIGESPAVIARKYNLTVDQLLKANNITDIKRIWAGQKLIIPGAAQQATTSPAPTPTPALAAPIVSAP